MVPSTISNLLDRCVNIALLISGDAGSVLVVLHFGTIPRSIMNMDGTTEAWVVVSMLTGLGGTRVNRNTPLAIETTSIAVNPNSNGWCDGD